MFYSVLIVTFMIKLGTITVRRSFSITLTSKAQCIFLVHRDTSKQVHPPALRPYLPDIEAFARHNHFNVLHPILRLVKRRF